MTNNFKWKKSRLSGAIALLAQGIGFLSACVGLLVARKKESAAVFGIVGTLSGVIGAYLLLLERIEAIEFENFRKRWMEEDEFGYPDEDSYDMLDDELVEDEGDAAEKQPVEIPIDDTVDESEFTEHS